MDLPKPSHNVILAGVMAVAVLAIMLASYVAYPDMGSTDNEKSSDYENTGPITFRMEFIKTDAHTCPWVN